MLITGAGSGLGRLLALHLAKLKLVKHFRLWDLNLSGLRETEIQLRALSGSESDVNSHFDVQIQQVDVSDRQKVFEAAEEGVTPTLLFLNAGVVPFLSQ